MATGSDQLYMQVHGEPPVMKSTEESIADLRAMGAKNTDPPLAPSPCLKVIKTGVIVPWVESMAERPDLCVNCDENGNEDPAAWWGRLPRGMRTDGSMPQLAEIPSRPASVHLQGQFDPRLRTMPVINPSAARLGSPPVEAAGQVLGVTAEHATGFKDPDKTHRPLMPFEGMADYLVEDVAQAAQEQLIAVG